MAETVAIVGDGAMGTVCAAILANKGYSVVLWSYFADHIEDLRQHRENRRFLPGIGLPAAIRFTAEDEEAFRDCGMIISAVPCAFLRQVWQRLKGRLPRHMPIVSVTKGIENDTLKRPTQIIDELTGPRPLATLSGPNIADELSRSLPATSTVASANAALAQQVQKIFSTNWLRIYTNPDVPGVELAGATKNVIAIAAGIIDGLGAGDNAKAALLTRGLVEITRLGVAMGAQQETFSGLSGMGDLVTTCISPSGRNRSFGQAIGRGATVQEALASIAGEVEGVNTCRSVAKLAEKHAVDMPIARAVFQVLFENKPVTQAITELMTRQLKAESVK